MIYANEALSIESRYTLQAIDALLCKELAARIQEKYDIDALSTPRSASRLRQACERLRRVLSANAESSIALDCLVGETDVQVTMTRERLEQLAMPLIDSSVTSCLDAVNRAGLELNDIHAVELIGGYSRTPAFANAIAAAFGRQPSRTLNAEEAVAKGAALAAGMRCSSLKMRTLNLNERLLHPSTICWERAAGGTPTGEHLLEQGQSVPFQKRLTLSTRWPMRISWRSGLRRHRCVLSCLVGPEKASVARKLRVDIAIDENQIPSMVAFELVGKDICNDGSQHEEVATMEANMESDRAHIGEEHHSFGNVDDCDQSGDTMVRPIDMTMVEAFGLDQVEMQEAIEREQAMQQRDTLVAQAHDAKNAFESELYRSRASLLSNLAPFMSEVEQTQLIATFDSLEDWLYGDGEQQPAERYDSELAQLRKTLAPFEQLQRLYDVAEAELKQLEILCDRAQSLNATGNPTVTEVKGWLASAHRDLATQSRNLPPPFAEGAVRQKICAIEELYSGMQASVETGRNSSEPCLGVDEDAPFDLHTCDDSDSIGS